MKRLAHISDPHFGKSDSVIERALLADLADADVIAISGDLTQRARREQFIQAREFLAKLRAPYVVVPGNHDVPVEPISRVLSPLGRYRRYITDDLVPEFSDGELAMVGIDTAHGLTTQYGRITDAHLGAICASLSKRPAHWKILVTHHPLVVPPHREDDLVRGAHEALPRLEECGIEVLLSGHTHATFADAAVRSTDRKLIAVHAGTCISTRLRGEPNGYNWLAFDGDRVTVTHRWWTGARFVDGATQRYERRAKDVLDGPVLARV